MVQLNTLNPPEVVLLLLLRSFSNQYVSRMNFVGYMIKLLIGEIAVKVLNCFQRMLESSAGD
jgi:hypothetical protein